MIRIIERGLDALPIGINTARKRSTPRELSPANQRWQRFQPFLDTPIKQTTMLQPIGTTEPTTRWAYLERAAELARLIATQHLDLPTTDQELAANGSPAVRIASSSDSPTDDERLAAQLAINHLNLVGYDPDPLTIAAVSRRIEWEQYIMRCGPVETASLAQTPDGSVVINFSNRRVDPAFVARATSTLGELIARTTMEDIRNNRIRARYYNEIGSATYGVRTGEHHPIQDLDNRGADDHPQRPRPGEGGGPVELGLHDPANPYEPDEDALWIEGAEPEHIVLRPPSDRE